MLLKKEDDNPTIGILLCRDEHKLTAELALKDINKPIGVAEYKYLQELPEYLANNLPSIETLEKRLNNKEENQNLEENFKYMNYIKIQISTCKPQTFMLN